MINGSKQVSSFVKKMIKVKMSFQLFMKTRFLRLNLDIFLNMITLLTLGREWLEGWGLAHSFVQLVLDQSKTLK